MNSPAPEKCAVIKPFCITFSIHFLRPRIRLIWWPQRSVPFPRGRRRKKRPLATDHTGYETLERILFSTSHEEKGQHYNIGQAPVRSGPPSIFHLGPSLCYNSQWYGSIGLIVIHTIMNPASNRGWAPLLKILLWIQFFWGAVFLQKMVYSGKGKITTIIYGKLNFLLHFHCFVMSYFIKASDYAERDFHEKKVKK